MKLSSFLPHNYHWILILLPFFPLSFSHMNPNFCFDSHYPTLTLPSVPSVPLLSVFLPFALLPTSGTHRYLLISLVHSQDQRVELPLGITPEQVEFSPFPPCTLAINTPHLPVISSKILIFWCNLFSFPLSFLLATKLNVSKWISVL